MESTEGARIIERSWRMEREITPVMFKMDMKYAEYMQAPAYSWSGTDRSGQPLTVTWVAGPESGDVYSAYEITPEGRGDQIVYHGHDLAPHRASKIVRSDTRDAILGLARLERAVISEWEGADRQGRPLRVIWINRRRYRAPGWSLESIESSD